MENFKNKLSYKVKDRIYQKVQKSASCFSLGGVVGTLVSVKEPFLCGSFVAVSAFSVLVCSVLNVLISKNIKEIRKLYEEFIKNYNQLNKLFGFKNPAELQAMFVWLLDRGYLSKDKTYSIDEKQIRDYIPIRGASILIGTGVCRNISPMFTDSVNDYGIEAFTLSVREDAYDIDISRIYELQRIVLDTIKETLDNPMLKDTDVQEVELFLNQKRKEIEQDRIDAILSSKRKQIINKSNHVISLAVWNGEAYYLGPNRHEAFEYDPISKLLYSDNATIQINLTRSMQFNDEDRMKRLQEFLKSPYPCASKEEILKLMEATEKICEQNRDIFEQFHRENKELYEEVTMRLRKI